MKLSYPILIILLSHCSFSLNELVSCDDFKVYRTKCLVINQWRKKPARSINWMQYKFQNLVGQNSLYLGGDNLLMSIVGPVVLKLRIIHAIFALYRLELRHCYI